ncbi:MAG: hypothetical protein ACO3B3_09910, partial [Cyanobium sp.]
SIFFLLVEINRRIYKRNHLGNLGRESDYVFRTDNHIGGRLRKTYLADRQPDPLPRTEWVDRRDQPEPPH